MKQETNSESSLSSQQPESRKQKLDKKRKIRKDKLQLHHLTPHELKNIDTKQLTKQQKAAVQKAKNREAAQKSRDTHKEYVKHLEQEVKELKDACQRHLCWRCKQILEEENHQQSPHIDEHSGSTYPHYALPQDQSSPMIAFNITHQNNVFEDELFLRGEDNSQNSFLIGSGLFILAIVVAAICIISFNYIPNQPSRALMEIPFSQQSKESVISINKIELPTNNDKEDTNKTAIVKVEKQEYGLIALNSDDCLKSLMKIEQAHPIVEKSLTSYNDHTVNQNYLTHQEGILLCQLRMPKQSSFSQKLSQLRTPLIRLYLLGSQIKDLISNFNLMIPIRDSSNIQTNGIYQVLARIKQVNMVSNHNCLL